jgi:hypothetical protein
MTITTPFRLRVLEALTTELATIVRTGTPAYVLTGAVFRGRGAYGKNDPLPMLSILEDPKQLNDDEAVQESNQATQTIYRLLIQGFIQDDPEHPTDPAHYLLADVKAKLYAIRAAGSGMGKHNTILGFGPTFPCISDLQIGSGVIRPPDMEISDKSWFFLPLR